MIHSNNFLKECEALQQAGWKPELRAGMRIGRGFADLGYEEFFFLPQNKLVSIYTGEASEYNPAERDFFFLVPNTKQLVAQVNHCECEIVSLEHEDSREWVLSLNQNDQQFQYRGASVTSVLLEALKSLLKN